MIFGEKRTDIWSGDLISENEFVCNISQGRILFWDTTCEVFRVCFWERDSDGKMILNGWNCFNSISDVISFTNP